ncbi:hypothetical protein BsWGS_00551 [Bradybaena similaris]
MESSPHNEKVKHVQHTAALSIGILCIVVGVPLWWKTTEVYRVSLPYSDIQHLSDSKIEYLIEINVIWISGQKKEGSFLSDLALRLNRLLDSGKNKASALSPSYRFAVREADSSERLALKNVEIASDLNHVAPSEKLNQYNVLVTDSSNVVTQPVLAANNNLFLPYNNAEVDGLSSQIVQLVKDAIRDSAVVKSFEAAKGLRAQRPDKDIMRSYRFHAGYDIAFTLMVPEPQNLNVDWDIEAGTRDYLQPMLDSLSEYTSISVTSQVLYLVSLGGRPKKGDNFFYYTEQDLPHIINPLETKLGSHASNNPTLNFIVCIPTQDRSPLYILDSNGKQLPSNAFLSPRWGGILIYNTEQKDANVSTSLAQSVQIDMHRVMEVFVSQVRLLLNIHAQMVTKEMMVLTTGSSRLQQWEIAGWLRCRCVENLATATSTLQSLAQLLEEIGNIVISDEIGKEVESAVASIKSSRQLLASGQLKEAFLASRAAVEASEMAFFHPSLLELLYFPEDQKFAIYIPLFLPISIPIMMSIMQAVKWFKQQKKLKAD